MDAKPYKPSRAMRVLNDENAIPSAPLSKTIHSRNKSSPALSTMAAAGAMRTAAKRSAFADVSNLAGNRLVKDDLLLPGKPNMLKIKTETSLIQPLARPAHRPLKDASEAPKNTVAPMKMQEKERVQTAKLPTSTHAESYTDLEQGSSLPTSEALAKAPISVEPVSLSEPAGLSVVTEKATVQQPSRKTQSISLLPAIQEPMLPPTKASINSWVDTAQPAQSVQHAPVPPPHGPSSAVVLDRAIEDRVIEAIKATQLAPHRTVEFPIPPSETALVPIDNKALATIQEPEEYWDDEDDEENFDEEGYVTARSFRSRENVTGNATTLLIPRPTQKARKEIVAAKELVESMKTLEDIEDEKFDTSMVAEYGDEIFDYLRELEAKMQPNPHYMDYQTEIQWSMRSVLMDWIVQVHLRFALLPETLFLCANYIDRFLSAKVVSLNKLQLVGATALFVAAKYEEINCPSVQEIVYMVDNGYTMDEVLKAERFMLSMLQFELGWPGPMSFLRRISKADDYDLETRTLAKYLLEITIMDERFLGCPPSYTAAGAHCMARMMLQKGDWSPAHVYYSNYTYVQLLPLISLIFECCEDPQKHHSAIFEKYADKRYKNASSFVSNQIHTQSFRLARAPLETPPASNGMYEKLLWGQEYLPLPWQ